MSHSPALVRPRPQFDSAAAAVPAPAPLDMADLTVAYLEQLGVDTVFGIPGGAIEPMYDAIARNIRRGGRLRQIVARHESGAAFMADGYARETGRLGVCLATSGPGATNLITGVATAYSNNVPLLVITGQPALPSFGRHGLQESSCTGIDVLAMLRQCTRYNSLVSHPQQVETKLVSALQHALRGPRGPAHLAFPIDVLRSPSNVAGPQHALHSLLRRSALVDAATVGTLRAMLSSSAQVVMLIGAGCAPAIDAVLAFACAIGARFVTTPDGKGLIERQHRLYRGVFGFGGHALADATLADPSVDLILAVGTSMGEWNTSGWSGHLLNSRLVHIDDSDEHLIRSPMARLHVRGDIGATFAHLLAPGPDTAIARERRSQAASAPCWSARQLVDAPAAAASDAMPLKPQRLMTLMSSRCPPATRFLADAGNAVAWATHYLQPPDSRPRAHPPAVATSRGGWLRVTAHFAPMGWAIGAAVGTAAANRDAPVVCFTGDGSMLMNGQELSSAVAEQLSVVFVVLNDGAYGMVKHGQRLAGAEPIAFALPRTDFAALARALGAHALTIDSAAALASLDLDALCRRPGPTLIDVLIDGDEVPPISARMRVLAEGA